MINEHYIPEAVVLVSGEHPAHELPLHLSVEVQFAVCCDGAANEYISHGHTPDVVIGDGDSLPSRYKKCFFSIILRISNRETNDQTKVAHYLQSRGIWKIVIVGAIGKREDHTLGNVSLLMEYMKSGMEMRIVTDYGTFIPMSDTQNFASYPGQQASIINFGVKGLKAEGLFYPLSDFTNWWRGTFNKATANELTIHRTGEYLVFLVY